MNIELTTPFPFESLPRVWRWIEPFRAKVADDFSPRDEHQFIAHMVEKWEGQKTWAIYRDSELGGLITFEKLSPWLGTAHLLLKPDFQGKGISLPVCKQAIAAMFEEGVGKLEFYPLAGNLAVGSLIVNLGAQREGRLRAHTVCDGKPTDVCVYGLLKEEFEKCQSH